MRIVGVWRSDIGKLAEILVGCSIEITSQRGNLKTATVLEVIERRECFAQIRDSGKG